MISGFAVGLRMFPCALCILPLLGELSLSPLVYSPWVPRQGPAVDFAVAWGLNEFQLATLLLPALFAVFRLAGPCIAFLSTWDGVPLAFQWLQRCFARIWLVGEAYSISYYIWIVVAPSALFDDVSLFLTSWRVVVIFFQNFCFDILIELLPRHHGEVFVAFATYSVTRTVDVSRVAPWSDDGILRALALTLIKLLFAETCVVRFSSPSFQFLSRES